MTARHVLLATELGDGQRQADRFLPLAAGFAGAGHRASVAMPADMAAVPRIATAGWTVAAAPAWRAPPPPGFLASCYADILLHSGYATPRALGEMLTGWLRLLRTAAPALVIADFAPTALLACRIAGIPAATLGDGYTLPPPATAMRPWAPPWADRPADGIAAAEGRTLAAINAALHTEGASPLAGFAELLAGEDSFLCTFPELDHYAGRADAEYFGEILRPVPGIQPDWPAGSAERAFVAVDPRHRPFRPLLQALAALGLPTLVWGAGLTEAQAAELSGPGVRVVSEQVDVAALLGQCDFVVCQDIAMVAPALLASRPVLMMPQAVEQMMTLHRVAPQGLGHAIPPEADATAAGAAVRRLLDDSACRLRVANFARRYSGYRSSMAIDAIVAACLELPALSAA